MRKTDQCTTTLIMWSWSHKSNSGYVLAGVRLMAEFKILFKLRIKVKFRHGELRWV